MMKTKKIPMRMCLGCGEMKPKRELIRVVKSKEGDISLDLTGKKSGRGAYICKSVECFEKARKARKFERSFSLGKMNNKIGLVTMCRKAGKLVMGMDMVKDACNTGKACAVFAATDFSPKSLKEIKFNCYKNGIKLYSLGMTMDDIHFGLGKRTGVIAICEGGFAKACAKGLEEIPIDENEFYSI